MTRVTLADLQPERMARFLSRRDDQRLHPIALDVTDHDAVLAAMRGHDAVMSAIPYYFNGPMAKLAVEAGCHFADLGGNTEIVMEQKSLEPLAHQKGLSIMPDCGLAPGWEILPRRIRRPTRSTGTNLRRRTAPASEPPLNYNCLLLEGALDYTRRPPGSAWRRADRDRRLSELEPVKFPEPVGTLEAFHTAGGISTMPFTWKGKVREMEYKTLRYPGHADLMRAVREMGLLGLEPVMVKGHKVVPRDAFIATVTPLLTKPEGRDLVACGSWPAAPR